MSLHDLLGRDVRQVIADHPDEITVHQNGNDVGPFPALVTRTIPGTDGQTGLIFHEVRVLIRKSEDPAVGVLTLDKRTDEITLEFRKGEPAQRGRIVAVLSENAGFFRAVVSR